MSKTNSKVARSRAFKKLCSLAGVEPTPRQVSKLRNGKGPLAPIMSALQEEYPKLPKGTCFTTFSRANPKCSTCTLAEDCFKATHKELFR